MNILQQVKAMVWQNNTCAVCDKHTTADLLCPKCQDLLNSLTNCEQCGFFIADRANHHCAHSDHTAALLTCFPYDSAIKKQLFLLKYHNKPQIAARLAPLLAHRWQNFAHTVHADAIVPVPLHPQRLTERGYNQSTLLAKALTKELHLPIYSNAIKRIANTRPLHSLSAAERHESLKNAFAAGADIDKIKGKNIILLDDIITTGLTIGFCSEVLQKDGVNSVYALAVAGHLVK